MNINQTTILGRLVRDPELKALASGSKIANFSIATSRSFTKADGTKEESTEFHNIIAFGKVAELCAQYLKKGQLAGIEGRLQTRNWESDGHKNYRTEIVAHNVQFGPKAQNALRTNDEGRDDKDQASGNPHTAVPKTAAKSGGLKPAIGPDDDQIEYPQDDINPDDIPF